MWRIAPWNSSSMVPETANEDTIRFVHSRLRNLLYCRFNSSNKDVNKSRREPIKKKKKEQIITDARLFFVFLFVPFKRVFVAL